MDVSIKFNHSLSQYLKKYMVDYSYVSKIQHYPCCYISFIKGEFVNKNFLHVIATTSISITHRDQHLFEGVVEKIIKEQHYYHVFYIPKMYKPWTPKDFLNDEKFFQDKYQTYHCYRVNYVEQEPEIIQVQWDLKDLLNKPCKYIETQDLLYCETTAKLSKNLDITVNCVYSNAISFRVHAPAQLLDSHINGDNLGQIVDNISNINNQNMYILHGNIEKQQDNNYLSLQIINNVDCKIQENLPIEIKYDSATTNRHIIINQKCKEKIQYSHDLVDSIIQDTMIDTEEITKFINSYINHKIFNYGGVLIWEYHKYPVNVGDIIQFMEQDTKYRGIVEEITIKSGGAYGFGSIAIVKVSSFIDIDTSYDHKVDSIMNNIEYPAVYSIDTRNLWNEWQNKFTVQYSGENNKLTINTPVIHKINEIVQHKSILIIMED